MHFSRRAALLTGAALSLTGQVTNEPANVRTALAKVQDVEFRLSASAVNGASLKPVDGQLPTIKFHSGGVVSGFVGELRYFAETEITSDGGLRWDAPGLALLPVTARNGQTPAEEAFLRALASLRMVRLTDNEVTLSTGDGSTWLKFTRTNVTEALRELLDVELSLTRLVRNGRELPAPVGAVVTLSFLEGGRIGGRSAVNNYGGVFAVSAEGRLESIELGASSLRAGSPAWMEFEAAYFDALSAVKSLRLKSDGVVLENQEQGLSMQFRFPSR